LDLRQVFLAERKDNFPLGPSGIGGVVERLFEKANKMTGKDSIHEGFLRESKRLR
jgi:hypothetical protein